MATTDWTCGHCHGENPDGMRFCGHCGKPRESAAAPAAADPTSSIGSALREHVSVDTASRFVDERGAYAEDLRLITSLFADISGFTALAQRVDTEELLEIIDPLVARLGAIVARFEGTVEKYAGDAILAVFGAPVAHEDDAARAMIVALEMHRELDRCVLDLGPGAEGLTLHVGINSGHAIARVMGSEGRLDYGVLGDSVILAQRLEAHAKGGETLVGASTVELVGERFVLEPIGELTVKGKAEPVAAWRLIGERRRPATAVHEVRASFPDPTPDLIGREAEIRSLTESIDRLGRGRGRLVRVTGEPGSGKSTLVEAMQRIASARGVRWLETRSLSYGRAASYGLFAELVRDWARVEPAEPQASVMRRLALATTTAGIARFTPLFARLLGLPAMDSDGDTLEPEAFRRALHGAFVEWLAAPGGTPTVLLIEDLHWTDDASLALAADLAAAAADAPLLVLATRRPEGPALEMTEAAIDITLEPFGEADTARLLARVLGAEPAPALTAAVHGRTSGNPFFVVETARAFLEAGHLDPTAVPPTIEGVLAARIDRLLPADRELLQVASVLGRSVVEPMLAGLVEDPAQVAGGLVRLIETGLVDRDPSGDGTAIFHHTLVQDVAYGRLLRRRRRGLHLRAADTAERLYGSGDDAIDLLARHLYLARAGVRAVDALIQSADRGARLFANGEAIIALRRAEELALDDASASIDRLPAIRLARGDLHESTGAYAEAIECYVSVRDATNDPRAWLGLAVAHRDRGEYVSALAVIAQALEATSTMIPAVDPRPMLLERARGLGLMGRPFESVATLEAALASSDADARDPVVGRLLMQLARARTTAGRSDEAIELASRAVTILEDADDLSALGGALRIAGNALSSAERFDEAAATLQRALAVSERVGRSDEIAGALMNLGVLAMDRDRPADAIESYRRAIAEFERIGHGSGRASGYANLADALAHTDDLDEARVTAMRALALARELGHAFAEADSLDTLATIADRQDDPASAARLQEEAAEVYLRAGALKRATAAFDTAATRWDSAGDPARAAAARIRSADAR